MSCTGAILIGGKSSRMGSPKHELVLSDGRTMLHHMIDAVASVCSRVVLIGSSVLDHADGLAPITDLRPELGPLGGIEALLASGIDSKYLVCPCDLPLITADLLRFLFAHPSDAPATVFQVEGREVIEPLPAMIRAEILPAVQRVLDGQHRSVGQLMQAISPHIVRISSTQAMQLHNVNTKDDYEEALRLMTLDPQIFRRS